MKPIEFKGQNVIFAENQPEYQNLPALVIEGHEMEVISCWSFSESEWEAMSKNRCFYLRQLRFGKMIDGIYVPNLLQPILPMAELGDNIALI
jgi:hypothetical protein